MNWIKQNKFLSGFIAFMVIGVGALGYLLFAAKSHSDEVQADYDTKVHELNRLEHLKPYPEDANLKQFDEQKKAHAAVIEELRKSLAALQYPVPTLTPEGFQDELRKTVTRVVAAAAEKGVMLPGGKEAGKFFMDFDTYTAQPPRPEAAPVLGRQLKAAETLLTDLINVGVTSIEKFDRDRLPEEEGKGKKDGDAAGKGGKGEKSAKELVTAHKFFIEFITEQARFNKALTDIIKSKEQFFIPRLVTVHNQADSAPPRVVAPVGQPGAKPEDDKRGQFIFGSEKLSVTLLVELIDFAETAAK